MNRRERWAEAAKALLLAIVIVAGIAWFLSAVH